MALDGIWVFKVAGIYEWERVSTVFMEKGRYLGGSSESHAVGTYRVDGKKVNATIKITQHGKIRSVFGEKKKRFSVVFSGKRKKDQIIGTVSLKEGKSTDTTYLVRLLKQEDIPALP